jgi:hypothetical protein
MASLRVQSNVGYSESNAYDVNNPGNGQGKHDIWVNCLKIDFKRRRKTYSVVMQSVTISNIIQP